MMHFMGGVEIAVLAIYFLYLFEPQPSSKSVFLFVIFSSLILGVFWEIFEYSLGLTYHAFLGYKLDTAKDIILDLLGTLFFTFIFFKKRGFSLKKCLLSKKSQ